MILSPSRRWLRARVAQLEAENLHLLELIAYQRAELKGRAQVRIDASLAQRVVMAKAKTGATR